VFPSVVSGVLVTLCFPVVSWWWLCFVALVPVLVAVLRVRPSPADTFRAGFLVGLSCYFSMLWWIAKLVPAADVTIPWLMTPALILLVLYLALYPAFFLLLLRGLTKWRYSAVFLSAPAVWALLELARSRGELGFPWGLLGYALTGVPELTQAASVAGVVGVSFLVVLANVLISGVVAARRSSGRVLSATGLVLLALAWWYGGSLALERFDETKDAGGATVTVGVVQPNVDLAVKWRPEFKDSTFRLIERLTKEAASRGAQVVFFPETAATVYIDHPNYRKYRDWLMRVAREAGVPLFIGFLDYRPAENAAPGREPDSFNSSGLFTPDGRLLKYDKVHLLPFGEALPLAWKFRFLRKIDFGQANWEPGKWRDPIAADSVAFTPLICFESVFPDLCRRGVGDGSELLVNITNDGWFSDTPGPYQHAQMAVLRSVEFRRYLVRSANTGVSFVVDPAGRIVDRVGLFEEGLIVADVTPRDDLTVYARWGDWPLAALAALLIVFALLARPPHVGYDDALETDEEEPLIRVR
jgi:apolipoprotein N-acyltransferase